MALGKATSIFVAIVGSCNVYYFGNFYNPKISVSQKVVGLNYIFRFQKCLVINNNPVTNEKKPKNLTR